MGTVGYHLRGWLIMGIASLGLFIVAAVPLGHFSTTTPRTIYAAVVAPVAWIVYLLLLYFLVYRPMVLATEIFGEGDRIDENDERGVTLLTKEMHKLNRNIGSLIDETGDMHVLTDTLNSSVADRPEQEDMNEDNILNDGRIAQEQERGVP